MQKKKEGSKTRTHHCQECLLYELQKKKPRKKHPLCSGLSGLLLSMCLAAPLPLVLSHWMIWPQGGCSQGRPQSPYKTLSTPETLYEASILVLVQVQLKVPPWWNTVDFYSQLCLCYASQGSLLQAGMWSPGLSRRFPACSATSVQAVGCSQLAPAHESQQSTSLPNSCSRLHLGCLK